MWLRKECLVRIPEVCSMHCGYINPAFRKSPKCNAINVFPKPMISQEQYGYTFPFCLAFQKCHQSIWLSWVALLWVAKVASNKCGYISFCVLGVRKRGSNLRRYTICTFFWSQIEEEALCLHSLYLGGVPGVEKK